MVGSAAILADGTPSGAQLLGASACLKSGAGFTKLFVSEAFYPQAVCALPACVVREYAVHKEELFDCDTVAIGMGTGVSKELYQTLSELLGKFTGTLVLDADALNTLSEFGVEALKRKSCDVIITPHPKEFARLTGGNVKTVLENSVTLAQEFAKKYGVTVERLVELNPDIRTPNLIYVGEKVRVS